MSSKNKKVANRVKISSSERKRSKRLRHSSSPLRERYLEDMRLHKFTERTSGSYLEAVLRMVLHTNLSPTQISMRNYVNIFFTWKNVDIHRELLEFYMRL